MNLKKILCLPLIVAFLLGIATVNLAYAPGAVIYVSPAQSSANPGENFTISLMIDGVVNCWAWELKITWEPKLLDAVAITEGSFLKIGGMTFFAKSINQIFGEALFGSTLVGAPSGVTGSGELATVQFKVEEAGKCPLTIVETSLVDKNMATIPHTFASGFFGTPQEANLVAKSAWPEHHHYKVYPGDEDENQTVYAKVRNLGPSDLYVAVIFNAVRDDGKVLLANSTPMVLAAGATATVSADLGPLASLDAGKWAVEAYAVYSFYGVWPYVSQGDKMKTFAFAVVP